MINSENLKNLKLRHQKLQNQKLQMEIEERSREIHSEESEFVRSAKRLEDQRNELRLLCGEIVATFKVEPNRDTLLSDNPKKAIEALLFMADSWATRLAQIERGSESV